MIRATTTTTTELQNELDQPIGKTSALGLFVESQDVDGLKYSIFFVILLKWRNWMFCVFIPWSRKWAIFVTKQILKKICDHPLLLTKRAAEDVLEGMDSMLRQEDIIAAERLAMYIADVADEDDLEQNQDNLSCKISFIMSLLVGMLQLFSKMVWIIYLIALFLLYYDNVVNLLT